MRLAALSDGMDRVSKQNSALLAELARVKAAQVAANASRQVAIESAPEDNKVKQDRESDAEEPSRQQVYY